MWLIPPYSSAFMLLMETDRSDYKVSHTVLTMTSAPAVGAGAAGTGSAAGSADWLSNRCLSIGWSSSWCSSTLSPYRQSTTTSLCG